MSTTQIFTEPHRKGTKMTVHCPDHGSIGVRFLLEEAKQIAVDHEFKHLTA